MTHFKDLSDYAFLDSVSRPGTKNIGWLALADEFEKLEPTETILDLLWSFCSISVAQTRGLHDCEFCSQNSSFVAERHGQRLLLGSAEIRVFSADAKIYAAPNLIYHYVSVHHYRPPEEFVLALEEGPQPTTQKYFERLSETGLEWSKTLVPTVDQVRFRFEKTERGVVKRLCE
jgi:hypothetical protein